MPSYMGGNSRARVDVNHPDAWAICDLCGNLRNLRDLKWQMEYRGNTLQRTGFLRCEPCLDVPHQFNRPVYTGPDPLPVLNARPNQWPSEMGPPPPNVPVQQIIEGDDD